MDLDWGAQPIPGKSMFNLDLGTSYVDVMSLLKQKMTSLDTFQIKNSRIMRLHVSADKSAVFFKKIESDHYEWQSKVALLYFRDGLLQSITAYLNDPYSYRGLIEKKIGLGAEIRCLNEYFEMEYSDADEAFYTLRDGKLNGLELHGNSCDLSVDPTQRVATMRVFM